MQLAPGSLPRDSRSDAPNEVGSRQQEWTCPDLCRFYRAVSTNWMLGDNQGSIRDVVDSSGSLINHVVYDSFGKVQSQSNAGYELRFGYTGREQDGETGLDYYRARYYDASNGRFISEDPIGFDAGDSNLTRYVFNSPTNHTDPSGEVVPLVIGGLTLAQWAGVTLFGIGVVGTANQINNQNSHSEDPRKTHPINPQGVIPEVGNCNPKPPKCDKFDDILSKVVEELIQSNQNYLGEVNDFGYTGKNHTLNGSEVQKDLKKGKGVHVFNDDINIKELTQQARQKGVYNDNIRGWDRFTYQSDTPIGKRIQKGKSDIPLNIVELKARLKNGKWEYHIAPRGKPAAKKPPGC